MLNFYRMFSLSEFLVLFCFQSDSDPASSCCIPRPISLTWTQGPWLVWLAGAHGAACFLADTECDCSVSDSFVPWQLRSPRLLTALGSAHQSLGASLRVCRCGSIKNWVWDQGDCTVGQALPNTVTLGSAPALHRVQSPVRSNHRALPGAAPRHPGDGLLAACCWYDPQCGPPSRCLVGCILNQGTSRLPVTPACSERSFRGAYAVP